MKCLLIALAFLIPSLSFAEDAAELGEVVVTAGTNYQVQQNVSPYVFNSSIHLQETSPGMKSPYIGAFTGNQVDQTLNGIRMNNALFRSGPNQYYGWVPDSFVKSVRVSDGGNVGGTISRELGVTDSSVGYTFDSANQASTETGSYKGDLFGFAFSKTDTSNMRTAKGEIPHSSYNQLAFMATANWSLSDKTTLIYSKSDDLERTDKWNGGLRSSGVQAPSVYTYQLQEYTFLNHRIEHDSWQANFGYQNSVEHILDGTKKVQTDVKAYTVNASYWVTEALSLYSTNTFEDITYDNGVTAIAHDSYTTTKQGVRYNSRLAGLDVIVSGGLKQVAVSDLKGFSSPEGSVIVGKGGFFASLDYSTNSPSYSSLKQSTTTGRGTSVPNSSLTEENATTWRVGFKSAEFYVDTYYKHFANAFTSLTVAKNTYKPVNSGEINVVGATASVTKANLFDTGINFSTRLEFAYGKQRSSGVETPTSKTVPLTSYVKVDYKGIFAEWKYAPKDNLLSPSDLDDVRIYAYNTGYNVFNVGYSGSYSNVGYVVGVNNLFNDSGRVLGSSVSVGERSLFVAAKYRF